MRPTVAVVDYGIGNLFSVRHAFEHCGAEVDLVHSSEAIENAERLVLPGVGAFADGMRELKERNLTAAVKQFALSGRPFLGICLGMQMMLDVSEEFGVYEGLGLIPGRVVAIPSTGSNGNPHKIPHVGWNQLLQPAAPCSWKHTMLHSIPERSSVYFVHSFMAVPKDPRHRLADCHYDGIAVSALIRMGNLYGSQFHPEKSGPVGLQMIQNFLALKNLDPSNQSVAKEALS